MSAPGDAALRSFAELPPPHRREVRLHEVSREAVLAALAAVRTRRRLGLALALGAALLALPAAAAGVQLNLLLPKLDDALLGLLGIASAGHQDLGGALAVLVLFGPAAALGLVALVAWLGLPPPLVTHALPALLAALPPGGRYSVSAFYGVLRPEPAGPLSDTPLALWAELPGEAPWLLALDSASTTTRRTRQVASGVGVRGERRTRHSRRLSLSFTSARRELVRELGDQEPDGAALCEAFAAFREGPAAP